MAKKSNNNYITLREAAKYCCYSKEYLSLRARQWKLRAVKFGRDWMTKKEWIKEYVKEMKEYHKKLKEEKPQEQEQKQEIKRKTAPPLKDLPVGEELLSLKPKKDIKSRLPIFKLVFLTVLFFLLLFSNIVFGQQSLKSVFKDITNNPKIQQISKNSQEILRDFNEGIDILAKNIKTSFKTFAVLGQKQKLLDQGAKLSETVDDELILPFKEYGQWLGESLTSQFSKLKQTYVSIDKALDRIVMETFKKPFVVMPKMESEVKKEEFEQLKQDIRKLKEKGILTKETIREVEVSKVIKIEPVREVKREITKIDDEELAKLKERLSNVEEWKEDILELREITKKLQSRPAYTLAPTAPIYIANQGLQVGGNATFQSLGVSGMAGVKDLGVSGSTVLGSDVGDRLTVYAESYFYATTTFGTSTLVIDTAGNLTTTGNITTTNGGDVSISGDLISSDLTATGDLAVNGGGITSSAATFNLLNVTPTTINFGGGATAIEIGASSGTTSINNSLTVDGSVTLGNTNTDTITLNAYIADDVYIGANAETLSNSGFTMDGNDLFVAGMAGIEGNVYTDGSFIAGSTTTFGDAQIELTSGTLNINTTNNQPVTFGTGLVTTGGNLTVSGGTINIGSDVNLYRSTTDVLKTDDNFDALALRIGGTEVLTSGRVLQNISSISQTLLPTSDNTYDLGSSSYRWSDGYFYNAIKLPHGQVVDNVPWDGGGGLELNTGSSWGGAIDFYAKPSGTRTRLARLLLSSGAVGLELYDDSARVLFGSDSDVNLYRSAANTLKTDDSLIVAGTITSSSGTSSLANLTVTGNLTVNGNTTLGDASEDTLTFNASTLSIPNNLNIDSNTLFIDAANDRLGIGTTSPGRKLAVLESTSAIPETPKDWKVAFPPTCKP